MTLFLIHLFFQMGVFIAAFLFDFLVEPLSMGKVPGNMLISL